MVYEWLTNPPITRNEDENDYNKIKFTFTKKALTIFSEASKILFLLPFVQKALMEMYKFISPFHVNKIVPRKKRAEMGKSCNLFAPVFHIIIKFCKQSPSEFSKLNIIFF